MGGSGPGGAWWRPPRTATDAGGTHPTGMQSCFVINSDNLKLHNNVFINNYCDRRHERAQDKISNS